MGLEFVLGEFAGDFEEGEAGAGEFLHDEALAAEEAGAEFFAKVHGEGDAGLSEHEGVFLADDALAFGEFEGEDGAGELRGEGDESFFLRRGIGGEEERFAGDHAAQAFEHAALGGGVHFHVGGHPGHAAGFGVYGFSGFEPNVDGLHGGSANFILHSGDPFICAVGRINVGNIVARPTFLF